MATDIATGAQVPTNELPVHPLDASMSPGVAGVTPRVPVASDPASTGPLVGSVLDTTGMFAAQAAAGEADVAAAMHAGQAAEDNRRTHYAVTMSPLGASYGDGMTMPPGGLDPGVGSLGSGETLPAGWTYDPPRAGTPGTFTPAG